MPTMPNSAPRLQPARRGMLGLLALGALGIAAASHGYLMPYLPEPLAHPGAWLATLGAPGILIGLLVKQQRSELVQPPALGDDAAQRERREREAQHATERAALAEISAALNRIAEGKLSDALNLGSLPTHYRELGDAVRAAHLAASRQQASIARLTQEQATDAGLQAGLEHAFASGDFSPKLLLGGKPQTPLGHAASDLFAMIETAIADIAQLADALSRGKLTKTIDHNYPGNLGAACRGMNDAVVNLRETLGRINAVVGTVSGAARQIAIGNDTLSSRAQEQAANLEETASSMEEITAIVQQNAESAANVTSFVEQASTMAEHSTEAMAETSRAIGQMADSAKRIGDIVGVIDSLAFQTNILALNAAVEAARAGEHGRGFAVVATEVRQLSLRSADAARDIRQLIATSSQQTKASIERVDQQSGLMNELIGTIREINGHMRDIRAASSEQATGLGQVSQAIMRIDDATQQTSTLVDDSATNTRQLYGQARGLNHLVAEFDLGEAGKRAQTIHTEMPEIVQQAAARVAHAWEAAIRAHRLSLDDLFDTDYRPFGNTEPPKYHTRFDQIADQLLPEIQEPVLNGGAHLIYAIACDHNGYVPTHNQRYCAALTGDVAHDRVHNRTKRQFTDPVGQRCGKHPLPYLLQTYRRDTGEIVHDISAPVFVNGRHWGGFRIGYKTALDI